MKRYFFFSLVLLLAGALTGCIPSIPVTGPTETPQPIATPTISAIPQPPADTPDPSVKLDIDLLKNYSYVVENPDILVSLVNGEFTGDNIHSRFVEPAAFGDLNGDGLEDAALILATNLGGSGVFYDLVALLGTKSGPVQAGFVPFGDRQLINDLYITDGRVVLDYVTQGLADASCCPREHRLRSFLLLENTLRLASEQVLDANTTQADPLPNAILIDQPGMFGYLTSPLAVSGWVTLVPPEGRMEYYLTDLNGALVTSGDIQLAGEPGGPGSFTFDVVLDPLPTGIIKLELVDYAEGILRGRSMVDLLAP